MNIRIGRRKAAPEPCGHVSPIKPAVTAEDRAYCAVQLAKAVPGSAIADYWGFRLESGARLTGGAQ